MSYVSRTDLTNTDVQSTKLTLNLNPLLFLNTFSFTLTILILTCSRNLPLLWCIVVLLPQKPFFERFWRSLSSPFTVLCYRIRHSIIRNSKRRTQTPSKFRLDGRPVKTKRVVRKQNIFRFFSFKKSLFKWCVCYYNLSTSNFWSSSQVLWVFPRNVTKSCRKSYGCKEE